MAQYMSNAYSHTAGRWVVPGDRVSIRDEFGYNDAVGTFRGVAESGHYPAIDIEHFGAVVVDDALAQQLVGLAALAQQCLEFFQPGLQGVRAGRIEQPPLASHLARRARTINRVVSPRSLRSDEDRPLPRKTR